MLTQHSWPVLPPPFTWQPRPAETEREGGQVMEDLELSLAVEREELALVSPGALGGGVWQRGVRLPPCSEMLSPSDRLTLKLRATH